MASEPRVGGDTTGSTSGVLLKTYCGPGQQLEAVRYFTARVESDPRDPGKQSRQNAYLEALATLPYLHIHYGYFQSQVPAVQPLWGDLANLTRRK